MIMKFKFLSAVFAFVCIVSCSIMFSACGGGNPIPDDLIVAHLPDKVHVEYAANCFYVKDGNDIYSSSPVYSSDRQEVFLRENLSTAYITDLTYGDQMFATARWTGTAWQTAKDDAIYEDWIANDKNHTTVYGSIKDPHWRFGPATSHNMYYGYSDVNGAWMSEKSSVTQLANQNVTVGENQVECVVFEYVFEYGDVYNKTKYWYALDSGIYIKSLSISDKTKNIDTEGTPGETSAIYYKTGETMDSVLTAKGRGAVPVF